MTPEPNPSTDSPLTAEEEAALRDDVARSDAGSFRWVVPDDIRRLLATLDRDRATPASHPPSIAQRESWMNAGQFTRAETGLREALVDDMGQFILMTIPEKGWFNRKWASTRRRLLDRWAALTAIRETGEAKP